MNTDILILILFVIALAVAAVSGTLYFREVFQNGRDQS